MDSQLVGQPPLHSHSIVSLSALRAYKSECYAACQLSGPLQAQTFLPECQIECQSIYIYQLTIIIYLSVCLSNYLSIYLAGWLATYLSSYL